VNDWSWHRGVIGLILISSVLCGSFILAHAAPAGGAPAEPVGGFPWWLVIVLVILLLVSVLIVIRRRGGTIDREAYLLIKTGENAGTRIRLERTKTRIGGQDDNDVILPDDHISRHHALLTYDSGTFAVCDLNSLYGTFVDGKRVEKEPVVAGGIINLGKTVDLELIIHK